jgi:hypothetical protein
MEILRAYQTVTIPAQSIKLVKVKTAWKEGQSEGLVDCMLNTHQLELDIFAITDLIISQNDPKIQISNFLDRPIKLTRGKILGYMHDPNNCLAQESTLTNEEKGKTAKLAQLVRAVARRKPEDRPTPEG